ncbi:MAG TPA: Holliday junction branch migration protein RuvA [Lachnospiraceae bacterium]|nr:Holliday junction branch migration protein RuvA [Lachnospiraceae bacterium]
MISYIKGTLEDTMEDGIIIENNGIGYDIKTTSRLLMGLPKRGSQMKIYTYLYVREDALSLFGFADKEELQTFQLLIGINGIGPKAALAILSTLSVNELRFAVLSQDVKTISKAPGIGKKSAERLIIELKDKMKLEDALKWEEEPMEEEKTEDSKTEATLALVSLGYSNAEALRAISSIEGSEAMDTESLLKLALKKLM